MQQPQFRGFAGDREVMQERDLLGERQPRRLGWPVAMTLASHDPQQHGRVIRGASARLLTGGDVPVHLWRSRAHIAT